MINRVKRGLFKGPRTQIIGLQGPNTIHNSNGIRALKHYYLGPWTLRIGFGVHGLPSVHIFQRAADSGTCMFIWYILGAQGFLDRYFGTLI